MAEHQALVRAVEGLAIKDVFVEETSAKIHAALDSQRDGGLSIQVRQWVDSSVDFRAEGQSEFARFRVHTGLRLLRNQGQDAEAPDGEVCVEVNAAFVADYEVVSPISDDEEALSAFAQKNAVFHVWPYWREYVHNLTYRMRLPNIVLPMFRVNREQEEEG